MTATKTPDVIEVQKKIFCDWFNAKYMVRIHFDGDKIVTPMFGARSQGRSVSLCANVAWAAWQETHHSVVIELPAATTLDAQFYFVEIAHDIRAQGYRVEVKS